jgi:hypothetical protein
MTADDLLVRAGTCLLHIGPHKTGTTAVQGALHMARERLAAHGVVYAGAYRQPLLAALAVTGKPALLGGPLPAMTYWEDLVREVREAGDRRVAVSSEGFADAGQAVARRVVEDLGGPRVHVVVTIRPLARIMPSQWQQYLQNGFRMPYLEWLDGILADPPRTPTPGFWYRHAHDKLIARWAATVGPQNLTVIVVDESDRLMLLRTFESLLGLPGGFLIPEDLVPNRSLTLAEAEVVRLLNEEFKRQQWSTRNYSRFMRYGAIEQMKTARQPSPDEPKIVTPAWALKRAAEIGAETAWNISALGVRVVGDISVLGGLPADRPETGVPAGHAAPLIPAEAAAQAVLGAFIAGRVGGQTIEQATSEVTARSLAGLLVKRAGQRAWRTLRPPRIDDRAEPPGSPGPPTWSAMDAGGQLKADAGAVAAPWPVSAAEAVAQAEPVPGFQNAADAPANSGL